MDEISYLLDNMNITTYSLPSKDICFGIKNEMYSEIIRLKNNRKLFLSTGYNGFSLLKHDVVITNEPNYTKVERPEDNYKNYYICLESECKYVAIVYSPSIEKDWDIESLSEISDFDLDFNDIYYEIYNNAKNYNPTTKKNNKEIDFKKEGKNIRKEKEVKISKGYYYEDVKEGGYGYYKGYFIIDNTLTIIEQTSSSSQKNVEQLRLVLELDSGTSMSYIYIIYIYSLNRINEIRRYRR